MAMLQRDDPPTPRLRPTLKLRHDKSVDKYNPSSLLRASACALCAMADKTADKYEVGGQGVACRHVRSSQG